MAASSVTQVKKHVGIRCLSQELLAG